MSFKEPGIERRQFGRRDTFIRGWVHVSGRPKTACTIRNLSPKGALLELTVPSWLPFKFELRLEGSGESYTCEIRHVLTSAVGVNFVAADKEAPSPHRAVDEVEEWSGLEASRRAGQAPANTSNELRKRVFGKPNP